MARTSFHHQKWEDINKEHQDEEDEALSLSDLPINLIDKDIQPGEEDHQPKESVEEFDFVSLVGSLRTESEMCAADEVFFQGQILPYRHSVSSECISAGLKKDMKLPTRSFSRSASSNGFTSSATSSRSNSIRSHQSSRSNSSSSLTTTQYKAKPIPHNQFLTHPSPKPQIKSSNYQHLSGTRNKKSSSVWEFFRLSLVRAPDIELQDLKTRTWSSHNNNNASKGNFLRTKDKKQRFLEKTMIGCKCSVETIPLNVAVDNYGTAMHDAVGDKMKELKTKQKKQQKQEMSRLRTFEWLKELSSHAEQRVESSRFGS